MLGLTSGCSALFEGASYYADTKEDYVVAKTAAGVAEVIEADKRADKIAGSIRGLRVGNTQIVIQMPDNNPYLWDKEDSDSNDEWTVFSKYVSENRDSRFGDENREIFLLKDDGSGYVRRLTYNFVLDKNPRFVGNKILWLQSGDVFINGKPCKDYFVVSYDLDTKKQRRLKNPVSKISELEKELSDIGCENFLRGR